MTRIEYTDHQFCIKHANWKNIERVTSKHPQKVYQRHFDEFANCQVIISSQQCSWNTRTYKIHLLKLFHFTGWTATFEESIMRKKTLPRLTSNIVYFSLKRRNNYKTCDDVRVKVEVIQNSVRKKLKKKNNCRLTAMVSQIKMYRKFTNFRQPNRILT